MSSKDPAAYKEMLARKEVGVEELELWRLEISQILEGMEKGLVILEKMGRPPEAKVLENKKKFQELLAGLEARLSKQ